VTVEVGCAVDGLTGPVARLLTSTRPREGGQAARNPAHSRMMSPSRGTGVVPDGVERLLVSWYLGGPPRVRRFHARTRRSMRASSPPAPHPSRRPGGTGLPYVGGLGQPAAFSPPSAVQNPAFPGGQRRRCRLPEALKGQAADGLEPWTPTTSSSGRRGSGVQDREDSESARSLPLILGLAGGGATNRSRSPRTSGSPGKRSYDWSYGITSDRVPTHPKPS
jgi:hypothetical protein